MTWRNPWAFTGLLSLLVPLLVHLYSRHRAQAQPFPSLRFITATRLLPTRRTRPTDVALMMLRMLLLLLAVLALADPVVRRNRNAAAPGSSTMTRVIVVDSSYSMQRRHVGALTAFDSAQRAAATLQSQSTAALVLTTATPSSVIAGGVAWLRQQRGNGSLELTIVSDFQLGAVDSVDLAQIPDDISVKLIPVGAADSLPSSPLRVDRSVGSMAVTFDVMDRGTRARWIGAPAAKDSMPAATLLTGSDTTGVRASRNVAEASGVMRADTTSIGAPLDVAIVYPDFNDRAALVSRSVAPSVKWMAATIVALHRDPLLLELSSSEQKRSSVGGPFPAHSVVVAVDNGGAPLITAARDTAAGANRLLLFVDRDVTSAVSVALQVALRRASTPSIHMRELEPATTDAARLNTWQRTARSDRGTTGNDDRGDARWFWLFVLLLLGVEMCWRREPQARADNAMTVERAA